MNKRWILSLLGFALAFFGIVYAGPILPAPFRVVAVLNLVLIFYLMVLQEKK